MEEREVADLEFKWGQKMGIDCLEKEARFYESFTYDGTEYTLYDCVYMYKEDEPEPYIGKLIGMWETVEKTKRVNIQWFFRPSEISKWLGDETPMQKEIFLAAGEGIGLSNVNPLEAIAGKCYVVCTSEDSRNRQPSQEEINLADYIFYRTFDVGLCTILDKIDDSVGGLEVKYVFNREESRNVYCLQTQGSSKVEVVGNTIACKGKNKFVMPTSFDEFKLLDTNGYHDKSVVIKDVKGILVDSGWIPGESSDYKFGNNSDVLGITNELQPSASGQRLKLSEFNSTMDGVEKVTNNKLRAKEKSSSDVLHDKPIKKARICNFTKPCEGKINNSSKKLLVQGENSMMPTFACEDETKFDDKDLRVNRGVGVAKKDQILKDRPIGILKDKPNGILKDKSSNQAKKIVTFDTNAKDFIKSGNHVERTSGLVKDSMLKSTFKDRDHGNARKFDNNKMSKVKKIENREVVAPRSVIDKGKWYTSSNKVLNAPEGTLLLLWNLDPKYTSKDVKDLIQNALQTSCVAIKLPRTKISSPHSGEALVRFNNNETAERVFSKLSEGCLMLPNGRPLVATAAPLLNSAEGQCTYFGHLVIDSIKLQGDARDAVSTSHCSQPNTIEYEMAMEWCLLQTHFDRGWESLYKHHSEDMRRLKANLKSK